MTSTYSELIPRLLSLRWFSVLDCVDAVCNYGGFRIVSGVGYTHCFFSLIAVFHVSSALNKGKSRAFRKGVVTVAL